MVQEQPAPRPVRNDVMQPAGEVLVMRHHRLQLGSHRQYYEWSKSGLWPFFMRIGARVVGEWKVIYPDGSPPPTDHEDGWRLARYAGMDHWRDTRGGQALGGNGPMADRYREAIRNRDRYLLGEDDVLFLTDGGMAPGGPYYLPGLDERYELASEGEDRLEDAPHPVRLDVAQPGDELVAFRRHKIEKGSFDRFHAPLPDAAWPFLDKIGARPIGEWRRFYPEPPAGARDTLRQGSDRRRREHDRGRAEYDEAVTMTRYASYEHWHATRNPVAIGGDGPDYRAAMDAYEARRALTQETSVQFLQGYLFPNPPTYGPPLNERYRQL